MGMNAYSLASAVLTLAVLIGFINYRYIKLQSTIAIMAASLLISLILLVLQHAGIANITAATKNLLLRTHFHNLLINGLLSFLLFAGALTIDLSILKSEKWVIAILSSFSTIASTVIVGTLVYYLLPFVHIKLPYLYCLLFGALISPTDPIAVLATFKHIHAPKKLEICVAGEALFNDGVAIVIFLTLYALTFNHSPVTVSNISVLFLQQAIGGITYGIILGFIASLLIRQSRDIRMIILITLAVASGGYNLALAMHVSGPLAMVVAGIFIGNTEKSHINQHDMLNMFWEIIDELLNAILFLLIGFELLVVQANGWEVIAALLAIPLVLLVRFVTVATPICIMEPKQHRQPYLVSILTWGGLRGGLAVALALALPPSHYRNFILAMTYAVVAFAVIVQGLSIKPLARRAKTKEIQQNQ